MQQIETTYKANGGKFQRYKISDLFNIYSPSKRFNANAVKFGGKYPYVVRTSQNNGIRDYITEDDKYLSPANTFSFGQDTATVFYQDKPYFTGDKIKIMKLKVGNLNKERACYLLAIIRKAFSNFSWGQTSFNETILNNVEIIIPTKNEKIDFEYMEKFINILEEERLQILETYLQVNSLDNCQLTDAEQLALDKITNKDIKFKEFKLNDLFTSQTGDVDIQRKHLNGKGTTYINSGITNCGVIGKTDFPAKIFKPNTITVDMFGNSYYRDFEYKMATHAHVFSLTPKEKFNKQIGLYICAATDYFKKCYSFSDMCNWNKMKKNNIILPVTINNTIDYDFMETYIKAIEKKVIQKVITWKDSEMKTLKIVS